MQKSMWIMVSFSDRHLGINYLKANTCISLLQLKKQNFYDNKIFMIMANTGGE